MEAELFKLLMERYGDRNVIRQQDNVDITVNEGSRRHFIEIKSNPIAKGAVRDAIGQLLEYAYCRPVKDWESIRLIIVAPGPETAEVSAYLKRLRARFGISVIYRRFNLGGPFVW